MSDRVKIKRKIKLTTGNTPGSYTGNLVLTLSLVCNSPQLLFGTQPNPNLVPTLTIICYWPSRLFELYSSKYDKTFGPYIFCLLKSKIISRLYTFSSRTVCLPARGPYTFGNWWLIYESQGSYIFAYWWFIYGYKWRDSSFISRFCKILKFSKTF